MTLQTSVHDLLLGDLGKRNNAAGRREAFNVIVPRTVAALTPRVFWRFLARYDA